MGNFKFYLLFTGCLLIMALTQHISAQVTVSSMFTNDMVLQQNTNVNIWGWANPGDTIAITGSWNNKTVKTATNSNKKWMLKLSTPAAKTDGTAYTITIKGSNTILLKDILIGEVWLLSGQSNMEMPLEGWDGASVEGSSQAISEANYPNIRLLIVEKKSVSIPQPNIEKNWTNGTWTACSSATVKSYSAVGYFFGKEIHTELKIPIGLVLSAWGGSSCETWANPASLNFVADYKNKDPWTSSGATTDNQTATVLYNGMIAPIVPFTFAGVLWYQGETNVGRAQQLTELFPAMIEGWRNDFQQKEMPFYFVQLAPYNGYGGSLPETWEAQAYAQKLKNTGMAGTLDAGDAANIHPAKKKPVGHRLALLALAKNYGQSNLVYSGPQYKSMQIEANKIRLNFDYTGKGLKAENNAPSQFEIAGDNLAFSPAKTLIDGHTLLVWSDQLTTPKHVRYAWKDAATASLFNIEGLPATPFRTNAPAYIQLLKANVLISSEIIKKGESVQFDWITLGTSEVTLNGSPVTASGSMLLKPDTVTNYTLLAKNESTSITKNFTVNVIPEGLFNWSLNKTATASSVYSGSNPSAAFDGNPTTFWKSNNINNQWISIDLGEKIPITGIVLNWNEAYGKAYQIQVSDDAKTWSTAVTELNGNGQIDFIQTNVLARYVRMFGTAMATPSGFSMKEMDVYSPHKPLMGALKDKNGNTMRGTPMVLGKSLTQSVAFAQNIENWKTIQNNGFNTIRICWVDPYYKDHSQPSWTVSEVLPYLDKCVENATATGMNLIINFHNVGAQLNFDKTYQFTLENEFWNAVAPRYKNNDLVYYEPANEPTFTTSDYLKPEFKTNYLKLYNSIRLLAPNRQILFFSFNGITSEIINVVDNYAAQMDWNHTTVAYHMYNSPTSASIKTVMAYHPVICTEWFYDHLSLLPGNEFIKRVDGFKLNAQTLENMGSGWVDWRDWDDISLNETFDTLITDARAKNYWWGKPISGLKATGISLSDKKIEIVSGKSRKLGVLIYPALAENQQVIWSTSNAELATVSGNGLVTAMSSRTASAIITAKSSDGGFTASCEVLIRASEAKLSYPDGNPHQLPGSINPTYFDQGGEGVGYHDLTKTNDGSGIRKEQGVDTEFRLPEGTVGGIVSAEWLEYTIDVLQDGNYSFDILFATAGRYGKFHLEFDGVDKTGQLSVPTSGNYSKFVPKTISGIALKKGTQVMRIYFDFAEYNLGMISAKREIPLAITELGKEGKPMVFPSPAHDQLFFSGIDSFSRFSILTLFGQILKHGNIAKNLTLDVGFLRSGNYLIRLEGDQRVQTEKFIKL